MGRIFTKHRRGFPTWSFTDFVKCCLSGNKSRLVSELDLYYLSWMSRRSSFSEGKAVTDFGLRTVLCHLLQITIEQSGRTTTRRKRWGCSGTSLPASPGWSRGCPVTAFGTSSPLLCHKHSSRIRKLNTLTVIIQYLNHLHISLVISAQIYFCRNTLNRDKQRYSRFLCSHVQSSVLWSPAAFQMLTCCRTSVRRSRKHSSGARHVRIGESRETCSSHPWQGQGPFRWEAIGHSNSDNDH